jgi:hypothetical protein
MNKMIVEYYGDEVNANWAWYNGATTKTETKINMKHTACPTRFEISHLAYGSINWGALGQKPLDRQRRPMRLSGRNGL